MTQADNQNAVETALEKMPSLAALLSVTLLGMSISHEWGYFWIVGAHFQTFISTIDYFTNGILWLPAGLFFVYGNVDWWRLKDTDPKEKNWKSWRTWIWRTVVFLAYASIFLNAGWPPNFAVSVNLLIVLIFLWSKLWRRLLPPNLAEKQFGVVVKEAFRTVPPLMIGMFIWGLMNANSDLASTSSPYVLTTKVDPTSSKLKILLRTFDKGLLAKNPASNRIEFIKWDDIASIEKPIEGQSRSFLCYALNYCPFAKVITP